MRGLSEEPNVATLNCCEMDGEGRISPKTLTFVVGETSVEVLNSKAL